VNVDHPQHLGPVDACSPLPQASLFTPPRDARFLVPHAYDFPRCAASLGLYAVVPDARWVERVISAGVRTVQLRAKSTDLAVLRSEIKQAVAAAQGAPHDVALFINDHWALAIEAGAYGVHLGQEDLLAADFAAIAQAGLRLGLSTHGHHELLLAIQARPSYIACGAIFGTQTKAVATPPQGLLRLARYLRLLRQSPDIATVAIGGIDAQRLPAVLATGVGGVAVISAIVGAPDWQQAVARLQAAFPA
jgi:thiamine-phosphate pyrophosphorylase